MNNNGKNMWFRIGESKGHIDQERIISDSFTVPKDYFNLLIQKEMKNLIMFIIFLLSFQKYNYYFTNIFIVF